MAGFTGFNPNVARSNILEFEDAGTIIYNDLCYYNKLFFDSLASVWFSPYAVDFGKEYTRVLYASQGQVQALVNNTIVKCVAAYNAIAKSNNVPTISDDHAVINPEDYAPNGTNMTYNDMLDIKDGVVGMDKDKVTSYIQEYKMYLNTVQSELDLFPLSIAFYDPNGELLAEFQAEVAAIKSTLESNFRSMEASISSRLIEEQEKVVAGAREAATKLAGQ